MNMNLLDYTITTGKKKGNSKHFKNFLAIHSNQMKLEKDNELLKWMVNEKEKELIKRGLKLRKLDSDISTLKTELEVANQALNTLRTENDTLIKQLESNF